MKRFLIATILVLVAIATVSCASGDNADERTDTSTTTTVEPVADTTTSPLPDTTAPTTTEGAVSTTEQETEPPTPETTPVVYEPRDFVLTAESVIKADPSVGYPEFSKRAEASYLVPGLNQYFIPQGMDIWEEMNWLMISGYFSNAMYSDCSVIVALDMTSGEFVGEYQLLNRDGSNHTGHAGGVAVTSKNMFISTGSQLLRISLADILAADRKGKIRIVEEINVPTRASLCNFSGGYLWVGDFYYDPGYLTDSYRHMTNREGKMYYAWTVGYKLDESCENEFPIEKWKAGMSYATPDVILSIEPKIQGFTYIPGKCFVLSQSYGRNANSHILLYDDTLNTAPHKTVELNGKSVPLWFLDGKLGKTDILAMPMAEGITAQNDSVYILFESGADKYRNGGGVNPTDRVWVMNIAVN